MIARGAVTIDGHRAKPGDRVDPTASDVRVHGKRVRAAESEHVTIALNKPLGMVTTMRDERGRPCVGDLLRSNKFDRSRRLFPIGRLDAQSTGLLLCTTDGDLCRRLSHPSFEVPRRYRVTVNAAPTDAAVRALGAERVQASAGGAAQFEMTLTRGQNREVRRSCAQFGLRVLALERTAFGPIALGALRQGEHRGLSERETQLLEREGRKRRTGVKQ